VLERAPEHGHSVSAEAVAQIHGFPIQAGHISLAQRMGDIDPFGDPFNPGVRGARMDEGSQ
jgi:hypothetical protein